MPGGPDVRCVDTYYDYPASSEEAQHWHVNFAHSDLFVAYGGPGLAQDELQVLEHPVLASLRERLVQEPMAELPPATVFDGAPTPILIEGALRLGQLETREHYGRRFSEAGEEALRSALTILPRPHATHLIAMEAIPGGRGAYSLDEIDYLIATAYTGFSAAVERTRSRGDADTVIHTGFWGCGAYGGNRRLMTLVQLVAARLADADELVFHAPGATSEFDDARRELARMTPRTLATERLLAAIESCGFAWGVSDGT